MIRVSTHCLKATGEPDISSATARQALDQPALHPILAQIAIIGRYIGMSVAPLVAPVVPRGQARIRTQMSAAHTFEQIDAAVAAFTQAGKELGVI